MRRDYLPLLFGALAGAAVLHGCNGPGLSRGSTSNAGATATAFYASGKAGLATASPSSIGLASFAGAGAAADPYALVVMDPTSTAVTIPVNTIAPAGTWLPLASVSEWTAIGNGLAADWAPRFLIYAQRTTSSTGGDAPLYLLDLGKTSGSNLPTEGVRFSTASTVTSGLCNFGPSAGLVLDDWPTPVNSWVALRVAGLDGSCSSVENQTIAIPLAAGADTAPMALGLTEPVEAFHNADGSLAGAIELVHILTSEIGSKAPTLQLADANLKVTGAIGTSQPMQGTGNTSGNGQADFQSLGITESGTWLYRDASSVMAINLASPAKTTALFTLTGSPPLGDVLPAGHALFDPNGSVAYVAVSNASGTSRIVRMDTSLSPPVATTVVAETAAASIQLVGLTATTGYLVYVAGSQPAVLKAVPKTGSNVAAPLIVSTLTLAQTFDAVPPALVGDLVYFTVDDSTGGTHPYRQLYSSTFSTGGASAPVAFASNVTACAVLVRPYYATPQSMTAPPVYGGILVAESPSFCLASDAALAYANAQLFTRDASGTTLASGQLPQLGAQLSNPPPNSATALQQVDFSYFFGEPGATAQLDGPVQSGTPTLLELDGATAQPSPAIDIELFTPGAGVGPTRLTQNLR
jgi:hypothetical protein